MISLPLSSFITPKLISIPVIVSALAQLQMASGKGVTKGCAKLIVGGLNCIFFLLGVAVLAVGVYGWLLYDDHLSILEGSNDVNTELSELPVQVAGHTAVALIVIGAFVLVLAFFGCCGAMKESKCLLFFYWLVLLLLIVGELTAAGFAYKAAKASDLEDDFRQGWTNANATWRTDVQDSFQCCGFSNSTDMPGPGCEADFTSGCYGVISEDIKHAGRVVAYVAGGIGLFEIFMLCCTCVICCSGDKQTRYGKIQNKDARPGDGRPRGAYNGTYQAGTRV